MFMTRRHMEFKINYLRHRLSLLPHGYFSSYKGRDVVYVTYDPDNDSVSRDNRRRYFCGTRRGKALSEQIKEYVELKGQLDLLLKDWKLLYNGEPRKISFPLTKRREGPIGYEFFIKAIPNQVIPQDGHIIDHKGHDLISKNEEAVSLILEKMGYPYKCGVNIRFDRYNSIHPDFLFYVPEIDKVFMVEIDGAMDQGSYVTKSYHTTASCIVNGFVEMKDFVVIRIGHGYEINSEQIEWMLWAAIDAAINDIIV